MYRTHAAVLHARLSAMDVLTVTVAYSWLMQYSRSGYSTGARSRFVAVFELYMSVVNALYKAYMRIGEILEADYGLCAAAELAMFGFPADQIADACEHKLRALSHADTNAEEREKVLQIKACAEWLLADLGKHGFVKTVLKADAAKP